MRRFVGVVTCALLIGGVLLQPIGSVASDGGAVAAQAELDERATRLRQRLGPFCKDFDFFYRHSFAQGQMRPVRCSRSGRERTVLLAYAFSDRATRNAWLSEWGRIAEERGTPVIKGRRFTVEVLVKHYRDEVRDRLWS